MERFPQRVKNRLSCIRYDENGAYFITICAKGKANLFWRTDSPDTSHVGAALRRPPLPNTSDSPDTSPVGAALRRPPSCLNARGIAIMNELAKFDEIYQGIITVDHFTVMPNHVHLLLSIHPEKVGGRRNAAPTISSVINQFKGSVTKAVGFSCWQKSFHDHVIRSENEYRKIWEYIDNNPYKWQEDRYYCPDAAPFLMQF